ncbi:MAG TPA: orotate phosphoribosyltransferase [Candidatus Limnocylindria bacterium]|nr:orotate phosphoribosyltransferase [Candidatus Limnocylindria bacterium]
MNQADPTDTAPSSPAEPDASRVEALFAAAGAYREGHFKLKSGRHADRYVEKFQLLQWPPAVVELCAMIAARAREVAGEEEIDVVVGPTTGGVMLAYEVARQLGVRGMFAESMRETGGTTRREFRRGFSIRPGERVLLVDDVITTGGSLVEMLPPIEAGGGELLLASVLVDRSGGLRQIDSPLSGRHYPVEALWTLSLPTFEPGAESCPGCVAGLPLEAPGSSGTSAT